MQERRKSARLVEAVNFKIGYETYDLSSVTLNLSTNGLLCRVSQEIPVMTKIGMVLLVPKINGQGEPRKVRVQGVVVRTQKDFEGLHKIAVFFTEISDAHKRVLHEFIEHRSKEKGRL